MYCGTEVGTIGPVETKLGSLGEVRGIVVGAFGGGPSIFTTLSTIWLYQEYKSPAPKKGGEDKCALRRQNWLSPPPSSDGLFPMLELELKPDSYLDGWR